MENIIITVSEIPEVRTDLFIYDSIKDQYPELTRSKLKNLLNSKSILLNNEILLKFNQKLQIGDTIEIKIPEPECSDILPQNIPLEIIYTDDDIIIVNKPRGLQTHPGGNNYNNTLVNALLYQFNDQLSSIGGVIRPGIVHRLDKLTTGLMVVAKNDYAHLHISKQLESRSLKRTYLALAFGHPFQKTGKIETFLKKHPIKRQLMKVSMHDGKKAITHFNVIKNYDEKIALIECNLETGRTHQIRVHLSHIGHSIIGDQDYGHNSNKIKNIKNDKLREKFTNLTGQLLHAHKIELIHPKTEELIKFEKEPPEDFQKILQHINEAD